MEGDKYVFLSGLIRPEAPSGITKVNRYPHLEKTPSCPLRLHIARFPILPHFQMIEQCEVMLK